MQRHTDDEKALIESFRAGGGKRIVFFRSGRPLLSKAEGKALSRLIRSGHILRHSSGDFGWVLYRLRGPIMGASSAVRDAQIASVEPGVVLDEGSGVMGRAS